MLLLAKEKSYAEDQYPMFNWMQIWRNFSNIIFYPHEKEIVFKHLHLCLATNQRLAMMGRSVTTRCEQCSSDMDHTPLHMFYQCEAVKPLFLWLLRVLLNISNFKPISNIKFIYFDTKYNSL